MNIHQKVGLPPILPARKVSGTVKQTLVGQKDVFRSVATDALELTYGGIKGGRHEGLTRSSGSLEPWYTRGSEMKNERQVTLISTEELAEISAAMGIERIDPSWIIGNLLVEGVPNLTLIPPRSVILFEGGASLRVDGYNPPCRNSGGSIAMENGVCEKDAKTSAMALSFVQAAYMKRGLLAWVEREGVVKPGDSFTIRIYEQCLYE